MSDTLLLACAAGAVLALILLITRLKLHPFVALLLCSGGMGLAAGMAPTAIVKSFQDGVGSVLAFIAVVVGLGTMLGKLLADSGGAETIARTLIDLFGVRRVHWAIMLVAFIVGVPVFFQVGLVLLIPLIFTVARQTGTSLIKVGIPLVAGLSIVHGIVPPHPAAMLAVGTFHADVGRTILYSLIVGLPAAALAGPVFGAWIAKRVALPHNPLAEQLGASTSADPPSFVTAMATILLPVALMVLASLADVALPKGTALAATLAFIGNPIVALLIALLVAMVTFGVRRGFSGTDLLGRLNDCLGPTAAILLVIGAGGGFNRVLVDSGVGAAIARLAVAAHVSPLILAFLVAGTIRVATGSATVALTTSAGTVAPIAAAALAPVPPELLVLAAGSGSLILSHVNDSGFWMIKEYFGMTVPQTLKTWTAMETILGVSAFLFTLVLAALI
jgi:GntP family gluconate:H+ symporter